MTGSLLLADQQTEMICISIRPSSGMNTYGRNYIIMSYIDADNIFSIYTTSKALQSADVTTPVYI